MPRLLLLAALLVSQFPSSLWGSRLPHYYSPNPHHGTEVKASQENRRDPKIWFNAVDIVRVDHSECEAATGGLSGTCYTEQQCDEQEGTINGYCSDDISVCCVVEASCGSTITKNNTHVFNPDYDSAYNEAGVCSINIKPTDGTTQLLIEYVELSLHAPEEGSCDEDTVEFKGAKSGVTVPIICGENDGQHMHIDVDGSGSYTLTITTSSKSFDRKWNIKISFLNPDDPCIAPAKCLQYQKDTSGSINSFNGDNELINDLDYNICFATGTEYCSVALDFGTFEIGSGFCDNDYLEANDHPFCDNEEGYPEIVNDTFVNVVTDGDNAEEQAGFVGTYVMESC